MSHRNTILQDVISRQERMLRLAERDYGLTAKVIHAETGIPIPTLASWRKGAAMSAGDFVVLCRVIPDDLTSLMVEPATKHIASNGDGDGCLDTLAEETSGFTDDYIKARSPNSPGGSTIIPMEAAKLKDRARRISVKARRAAA